MFPIGMIARWLVTAVCEICISLIAVILSPLLALLWETADRNDYSTAKGPRQFLLGWLQLFSTQDDGVDALWYEGLYDDRAPEGWPERARNGDAFAQYYLRVLWIIRNSGYGFAQLLFGFDRISGFTTKYLVQHGQWDSATTNYSLRIDTTTDGSNAFELKAQLYYTEKMFVRVFIGWKLSRDEVRPQIATHINPFRTWKK